MVSQIDKDSLRRFPVGHPDFPKTQMPARDATATGKIKRSNKFPNCSYFTNWVSKDDKISWPVDVLESGRFKAEIYYCCRESDVGMTIQLALGDIGISKKITIANDPPLVGAAEDRSVRGESLVKDFKPVELGVIELAKGQGELELRTAELPGKQSIEFRLLMLTRVE